MVWTTQTYPFGKQRYSGNIEFNLRYPGQYFDEETGLHYNGHRYYDPNTGRYITSDPIGLAGGINTYAYVGNDPLGSVDPLGLNADDLSETPGQRSLEQLHGQEHDVISPLVDTDIDNDGQSDVISPFVLNGGVAAKSGSSSCQGAAVTKKAPDITTPYKRPSGATTKAQRESVQNHPCVDCGNIANRQVADHKTPLVKEYYETGTIDKARMRSLDAVQPQCPTCSARQGAEMSRYSKQQKQDLGL